MELIQCDLINFIDPETIPKINKNIINSEKFKIISLK
jgi:hypothetical protein